MLYQLFRKVHLWVGLILAVVLIIEAVTGLILAEPGWFGEERGQKSPGIARQAAQGQAQPPERTRSAPSGVYGLAKGLHQGKVGNMDLGWVVDVSAVGLTVLTATGVYMAIPILRARNRKR